MKVYDCFMFFDENLVLELRLNLLDKYVDYFVIVESKYNHKGEAKKLNFDIKKFKKFEQKIIYIIYDQQPSDLYKFEKEDTKHDIDSKYIFNAYKRENAQRNLISQGLKNASLDDLIIISDVDEIPKLEKINFNKIKNEILVFRQDMFYYKFNLKLSNFKWTGSKACKMKKLISPQWLRSVKDKKFAFYRFDTFFSSTKYRNLKFIEDGGWHYTNMKNAKEIEYKLRSYLHHQEFEANHINLGQIEKIIKSKKAIYDVNADKRQSKFGEGPQLIKINSDEIPNYLKNNPQIYSKWLD
ncbi:hypothetical protein IDH30_05190 [Pelagibacterales bacterium SAG-MED15]|nr:hypothetical protein [Pelagibacterales bacterium SAG-MED15]